MASTDWTCAENIILRQVGSNWNNQNKKMAMASKAVTSVSVGQRLWNALSAWTIRNSGYQKLGMSSFMCTCLEYSLNGFPSVGLRREDLLNEDFPEIREAVRRLPEVERNLRHYRMKRALDLDLKRSILPRDQWTKPEEVSYI